MAQKTINIDGKDVVFSCNATFTRVFKNQFGYDILKIILPAMSEILQKMNSLPTNEQGDVEFSFDSLGDLLDGFSSISLLDIQNLIWAMAKTGDKSISEPEIWESQFEEFPILDISKELLPMFLNSLVTKKKLSQPKAPIMTR